MKMRFITVVFILFTGIILNACNNGTEEETNLIPDMGHVSFKFNHFVDGEPLIADSIMYVNTAGNPYEINQVMYFISDVTLHKSDGTKKMIGDWKDIHYVEIDIPSTLIWDVYDDIPAGTYDSITFIFGISEEKNKSFMFVNPPEDKMMWPDLLGGGYHYLMINGKWLDENNSIQFYNFHLGIGQLYKGDVIDYDSIYAFVQNYFTVNLPNSSLTMDSNTTKEIEIIMNIDSWFKTPHNFDFNYWGGAIMEIQSAMQIGVDNGYDVFTIGSIK